MQRRSPFLYITLATVRIAEPYNIKQLSSFRLKLSRAPFSVWRHPSGTFSSFSKIHASGSGSDEGGFDNCDRFSQSQKERLAKIKEGNFDYEPSKFEQEYFANSLKRKDEDKEEEGVACVGEPSTDPSRALQNMAGVDSDWMEDVAAARNSR